GIRRSRRRGAGHADQVIVSSIVYSAVPVVAPTSRAYSPPSGSVPLNVVWSLAIPSPFGEKRSNVALSSALVTVRSTVWPAVALNVHVSKAPRSTVPPTDVEVSPPGSSIGPRSGGGSGPAAPVIARSIV